MDIITKLVKEKYVAKYIFRIKREMEISDTKKIIQQELEKTDIINKYKNYTLSHDTIEYMNFIKNYEYVDIEDLVFCINMCGYHISYDEHELENDAFYEEDLEYEIRHIVYDDYDEELKDFFISKKIFEETLDIFNHMINVTYDIDNGFFSRISFECNGFNFYYDYLKEDITCNENKNYPFLSL